MSFLTQAGEAQIANKQGNATRMTVSHFVLAHVPNLGAEPSDRVASLPSDEQIVQTLPYSKHAYVNPNQVVYSLIMDSTIGDFRFNWIGLVDEEDVLIAVAHITPIEKRKSAEGVEGNTIARNFLLKYTGIQNVTGANVPADTWQLDFSTRFNGMDERERLSNLDLYGQASFLDGAYQVIKENNQYQLQAGVGYVGGIRTKLAEQESLAVSDLPCSVWLDVSLQGDVSDKVTVSQIQVQTEASSDFVSSDYVDSNSIVHYVSKLAAIDTNGEITDYRVIYDNVAQHEAKANPHPQYFEYTDEQCAATLAFAQQALSEHEAKADPHPQYQSKQSFSISGSANEIVLSSVAGTNPVSHLADHQCFSFVLSATNTAAVTIQIDDLDALSLVGVSAANQLLAGACVTLRYLAGAFYLESQINPKTGNAITDIGKLWIDTLDILRPGEYALDGSVINSKNHPIAVALIRASSNCITQSTKNANIQSYAGFYGYTDESDGSTSISLPIVGGEFIRMHDGGRGVDTGRGFASWQGDQIKAHSHNFTVGSASDMNPGANPLSVDDYYRGQPYTKVTASTGGNETRPRNLAYYGKTRL
ncbi:phage tail protein [Marinomonas aquiplantarum]|uniref:Tail-collar fiber protein n=1 Tax=Marinomonas aquiplantarum TaxID=491951 RepID=A0A366D798_9GAMM|nr:phage tail protein [Marinomonas aquiplantarum]RBO85903.1 tail-collar fiber protein [Marinomonas aquiplantarum]